MAVHREATELGDWPEPRKQSSYGSLNIRCAARSSQPLDRCGALWFTQS